MKTLLKVALGLFLAMLLLVAVGVAMSWAPDRPVESLKARWAPEPSRFVAVQGMQVHLRDEGPQDDPEPIVLLHGTSASLHTWDGWVAALKGQRRVIRLDLPGFGLTGPTPDHDYHLTRYTAFMAALLEELQLNKVVLAGNSFGGTVAWMTADAYPQRVSRLILVDAGGYPYKPTSIPIGFKLAQVPALKPLMANLLPRSMIESSVRNVYGDPSKVTPELIDRYYEITLREGNRRALRERFTQSPGGEHAERIAQLKLPTLILWGSEDHLIPPDNAERFQRDIAGSQLVMFRGLGHVPQEEDPAATVAAVKTFLGLN
ncbi:MAG: alpha/beta hydrolase [Rubrivivax sp.]|nr:MAG: alpha/beta hydrolase [Rubrivivax sp.]